jgi:hypothetical protein
MFYVFWSRIKRFLGFDTEHFCDIYDFPKFKYEKIDDCHTKMTVTNQDGKNFVRILKTAPSKHR